MNLSFYSLPALFAAPPEPLLCKFADGGQKKRQSQNKFAQNGRGWGRDADSRLVREGSEHFMYYYTEEGYKQEHSLPSFTDKSSKHNEFHASHLANVFYCLLFCVVKTDFYIMMMCWTTAVTSFIVVVKPVPCFAPRLGWRSLMTPVQLLFKTGKPHCQISPCAFTMHCGGVGGGQCAVVFLV